jgi:hypothetical protein
VQGGGLPWLVAERDGKVLGYAYATKWRVRHAYRFSVESSCTWRLRRRGRAWARPCTRRCWRSWPNAAPSGHRRHRPAERRQRGPARENGLRKSRPLPRSGLQVRPLAGWLLAENLA